MPLPNISESSVWQATVSGPFGERIHVLLQNQSTVLDLKEVVTSRTGIPSSIQKVMSGIKLLPNCMKVCDIQEASHISINVSGKGGCERCDLCFDVAELHCAFCPSGSQTMCKTCFNCFHMHPERKLHTPTQLHVSTNNEKYEFDLQEDSQDEFVNSANVFEEAMLVATLAEKI